MARAPVSKTGGWGFESLHSCQGSRSRRDFLSFTATLAVTLIGGARPGFSQTPKTIRFIVPFPAGGGADLLMRVLSDQVGKTANVTTVVENRPGAASVVGTEFVSRAAPDGGTLLIAANSFIIHPFFKKLNYR